MKLTTILLSAILPFSFISCGEKEQSNAKSDQPSSKNQHDLDYLILKEKPADPISISDLRTTHKADETVTFSGQIIGSTDVLIEGMAVMIMGDPTKMTTCNLRPGDNCQTPWDVCCDDKDMIKNNIVTVQVLSPSGDVVKAGLRGLSGIKEMSDVTISGVIDKSSNKDNMIINATGIFVMPSMKHP